MAKKSKGTKKPKKATDTKGSGKDVKGDKDAKEAKAEKEKDPKVITKKIVRCLPCALSHEAKAKAGEDLVANMDKIEAIEQAKKTADAGFKKDIELLVEVETSLRNALKTGTRDSDVECEEETDYRSGEVRVKRLDTGEIFQRRTMDKEELQLPLDAARPAGKLLALDGGKGKDPKPEEEPCEECGGSGKVKIGGPPLDCKCEGCMGSGKVTPKKEPLTAKLGDVAAQHAKNKADAAAEKAEQAAGGHPEVERLLKARAQNASGKDLPTVGDRIEARGYAGWEEGSVGKIADKKITVNVGNDEVIEAEVDSDDWRWPEDAAKTKAKKKRGTKGNPNGVDTTPPPGCDF
jgi:hypothetical protein